MNFKNPPFSFFAFILVLPFLYSPANAVTINFDELDQEQMGGFLLTNEYESFGMQFWDAYLSSGGEGGKDISQGISGPGGFAFGFVDKLPVYISFTLNNWMKERVGVEARGPNGYMERFLTEGEVIGMNFEDGTPYIPNQRVTIRSEFGISLVSVSSKSSPFMDNLVFYYTMQEVPEPHLFILFILGVTGVFIRRCNFLQERHCNTAS